MRLALVLTILLLTGFATSPHANDLPDLDLGPVAQSCLSDPPAATETFMVSLCKGFAEIARKREASAHRPAQGKIEATTCDAVCRYPLDKARENIEAIEAGKTWGQREQARKDREAIDRQSARHAAPQCDAACRRYRQAMRDAQMDDATFEAELRASDPSAFIREYIGRAPISCTSYQLGMFTNTDCY